MTIRFDHTLPKIVNGQRVMSDYLDPNETLESGETYAEVAAQIKAQGHSLGIEPDEIPSPAARKWHGATIDATGTHTIGKMDLPPDTSADKRTWYDWAVDRRDLRVAYEDITKTEIIAKYKG